MNEVSSLKEKYIFHIRMDILVNIEHTLSGSSY